MLTKEREASYRKKHGCDKCLNWHRRSDKSIYYCYAKPVIPTWWTCNSFMKGGKDA